MRQLNTIRGHALLEVASALQKAIRRADARMAGYWAIELFESGYREYAWRRLLTISAEDCWGIVTFEVEALYRSWTIIDRQKKGGGRVFLAKAAILLAQAAKCRDADHLTNLIYDPAKVDSAALEAELDEARLHPETIPDYAFDCHTAQGKRAGKTKDQFFVEEFDALQPREKGLFDVELDEVREKGGQP